MLLLGLWYLVHGFISSKRPPNHENPMAHFVHGN